MKNIGNSKMVVILGAFFTGTSLLAAAFPAQSSEYEMDTDRPDATESARPLAKSTFQIENGIRVDKRGNEKEASFGEVLMRYGVSNNAELRFEVPNYLRVSDGGSSKFGFDDISLSAKIRLTSANASTVISVIPELTLPTGNRNVAARKFQPGVTLAFAFPDWGNVSVDSNIGYTRAHDGAERFNQLFASLSFSYDITDHLGTYIEGYVDSKDEAHGCSQKFLNTGITYLLKENTQLDAYIGKGVGNNVHGSDYFYGVGLAQRF